MNCSIYSNITMSDVQSRNVSWLLNQGYKMAYYNTIQFVVFQDKHSPKYIFLGRTGSVRLGITIGNSIATSIRQFINKVDR